MLISCRKLTCQVTEAREGSLSAWDRARYRLHLLICPMCRAYVRGFDQVLKALSALPPEDPPAPLVDALSERLRARSRGERP
jgi:hypothetical protein